MPYLISAWKAATKCITLMGISKSWSHNAAKKAKSLWVAPATHQCHCSERQKCQNPVHTTKPQEAGASHCWEETWAIHPSCCCCLWHSLTQDHFISTQFTAVQWNASFPQWGKENTDIVNTKTKPTKPKPSLRWEKLNTKVRTDPRLSISDLLSQQKSSLHNSLTKLIKNNILILQKRLETWYIHFM